MSWRYVPAGLSPAFYTLERAGFEVSVHDTADLVRPEEVVADSRYGWLVSSNGEPLAEGYAGSAEVAMRHAEWALGDLGGVMA